MFFTDFLKNNSKNNKAHRDYSGLDSCLVLCGTICLRRRNWPTANASYSIVVDSVRIRSLFFRPFLTKETTQ